MKKKLSIAIIIIVAVILVATWVAPYIILIADRQEKVADSYAYSEVFFDEYDEVREHLLATVDNLKNQGIETDLYSHAIDVEEDLYIDTIYLPSSTEQKNLVVLTTGVHGIEGYIGSVMLDVFWQEIYPDLNKENTGVLVIANVNPYGMKHHRRYNENNVDLNRNFIIDWEAFDTTVNKDYPKVDQFLGPQKKMGNALWHEAGFYASMVKEVVANGADSISNALLGGQYEYPQGVYYGGAGDEQSTTYVKDVFEWTLGESQYENVVHIDVHSGYGPRYNMVIFNSVYETMNEAETKALFGYDNVISYDSESFYATTGDTTDFYYRLKEQMGAETALFSTCFEFGTIGDSFLDSIISMKYTIEENQDYWYPTTDKVMNAIVRERYQELFYPTEMEWREKTVADFAAAAKGVLNAKLITE
ncbi:MAG: DUF2817 domain-containing protein [Lachnospiraceae bacterium]|nr:DUF2817 domain-containing protein [Lachnospiraceae bacterium]